MKIGGIQFFVWCSTCQWKSAGKDNVKQGLSQKVNYISYVETQQQVGKETLKVWKGNPKGLEVRCKGCSSCCYFFQFRKALEGWLSSSGRTSVVASCCTWRTLVFIVLVLQPAFSMLHIGTLHAGACACWKGLCAWQAFWFSDHTCDCSFNLANPSKQETNYWSKRSRGVMFRPWEFAYLFMAMFDFQPMPHWPKISPLNFNFPLPMAAKM